MTKTGCLLVLATVLASPLPADNRNSDRGDRGGHEHDGQCGHDQPGNGGGHGRHRSVCGAVAVSVAERPRAKEPFSVRKTLDLQFRMRLRTRDEDAHVVSFRVLTPKGHLYQQLQAPPEARKDNEGKNKESENDNDDGDDHQSHKSRVSARLPVAGTFIATSSLFGKWRVIPYIDDDPEPCAAGTVFSIVE